MSHWFFVEAAAITGDQIELSPEDSHHLLRVLRARPGEHFTAVSGGMAYRCELLAEPAPSRDDRARGGREARTNRDPRARGRIIGREPVAAEPPVQLTVFQGLPKGEKLEQVLQHGTEVGVTAFVPVACSRSVVRLDRKKAEERRERWQKVVREAAQQARRGAVPAVEPLHSWAAVVRRVPEFDLALVLWEQEAGRPGLRERLSRVRPGDCIALFVGPEGGLTPDEVAAAAEAGAHAVGLGPRILRTETAALAAAAAILYAVGDLGGPAGPAPYPANYRRYFELFNRHEFWEAHEALEELWQEDRDPFKQGLILFAAAFVHVQRNNPSGCEKLLRRTLDFLTPFAPRHWDLNVEGILAHARLCLELLERRPPETPLAGYIPWITLELEH